MTRGSLKTFLKTPTIRSKTSRTSKRQASTWSLSKLTKTVSRSQTSTRAFDTPWRAPTRTPALKTSRPVPKRHLFGITDKAVLSREIHRCSVKEFSTAFTLTARRPSHCRLITGWAPWEGTRPKTTTYNHQEWTRGAPTFWGGAKERMFPPISWKPGQRCTILNHRLQLSKLKFITCSSNWPYKRAQWSAPRSSPSRKAIILHFEAKLQIETERKLRRWSKLRPRGTLQNLSQRGSCRNLSRKSSLVHSCSPPPGSSLR